MTRLDLLVGVGVLSLLLSIAGVPGATSDARLLEVAEARIRSAVDLASGMARALRTPHGVAFDVEGDRIAVVDVQGGLVEDLLGDEETLRDLDNGKLATYVDLVDARFGRGGTVCVFDGDGLPMSAGQVRLTAGERGLELVIDEATGRVMVSMEPPGDG